VRRRDGRHTAEVTAAQRRRRPPGRAALEFGMSVSR
jgi:hypothetical protein